MKHEPGFKNILTAVPESDEASLAYINALIDGPFHKIKDKIHLLWHMGTNQYYLHIEKLDEIPAPVVYNFCIASRGPIEHKRIVKIFNDLVYRGVHKNLALALCGRTLSVYKEAKLVSNIIQPNQGHWWYNSLSDLKRIMTGDFVDLETGSFWENPSGCIPCNVIWGDKTDNTITLLMSLEGKTTVELSQIFEKELNHA